MDPNERALRAARRPLAAALQRAVRAVDWANLRLSHVLYDAAYTKRAPWPHELREREQALAKATTLFNERLVALQTYDALHLIAADYPAAPVLDRDATVAAARAKFAADMAAVRARYERPPTSFTQVNPLDVPFTPTPRRTP